jgi:hypothetical protein
MWATVWPLLLKVSPGLPEGESKKESSEDRKRNLKRCPGNRMTWMKPDKFLQRNEAEDEQRKAWGNLQRLSYYEASGDCDSESEPDLRQSDARSDD